MRNLFTGRAQSTAFIFGIFCMGAVVFTSCKKKVVGNATVIVSVDSHTDTLQISTKTIAVMTNGDKQYGLRTVSLSEETLELEIIPIEYAVDTANKMFNISKAKSHNQKLGLNKPERFDGGFVVTVAVMQQIPPDHSGDYCQGPCCSVTCYTSSCCSSDNEGKNCYHENCACQNNPPAGCGGGGGGSVPKPDIRDFLNLIKVREASIAVKMPE